MAHCLGNAVRGQELFFMVRVLRGTIHQQAAGLDDLAVEDLPPSQAARARGVLPEGALQRKPANVLRSILLNVFLLFTGVLSAFSWM